MTVYIIESSRDIAQPGLARLSGGQKVGSSNLPIPTIFLPKFWAKKHEAVRLRLMHRRCASYILMLDEQSSQAQNVLHKSLTMKHCFATAPQYEAAPVFISLRRGKPFHSDMKHFAYAPYDLSSIALRATDDEKMENESLSVCNTTLSALYYDLQSSPLWLDFFVS